MKQKPLTYDELVGEITRDAHDSLLREGGKGMRDAVWRGLHRAINWADEMERLEKEAKKAAAAAKKKKKLAAKKKFVD